MTKFVYNNSVYSATEVISFYIFIEKHSKMRFNLSSHKGQAIEASELIIKLNTIQKNLKLHLLQVNKKYLVYYNKCYTN